MDIIRYFGEFLSNIIGVPLLAACGVLRFSLKDEVGSAEEPDYETLLKTFKNSFINRLEWIGVENREEVASDMIKELNKKQSLITMSNL